MVCLQDLKWNSPFYIKDFNTQNISYRYTVNEALAIIDTLPKDMVQSAKLYIEPPDIHAGDSDEDSGDEDGGAPDRLCGNQLRAGAQLEVAQIDGTVLVYGDMDDSVLETPPQQPPKKKQSKFYASLTTLGSYHSLPGGGQSVSGGRG